MLDVDVGPYDIVFVVGLFGCTNRSSVVCLFVGVFLSTYLLLEVDQSIIIKYLVLVVNFTSAADATSYRQIIIHNDTSNRSDPYNCMFMACTDQIPTRY